MTASAARGRGPPRLVRPSERTPAPRRSGRVLLRRARHEARHGRRVRAAGRRRRSSPSMGLLPPTASVSGRVLLDGVDVLERGEQTVAPHRWKDIAMVFQGAMNAFDPVKRIGEQIAEPMELHGLATRQGGDGPRARAARDGRHPARTGPGATRTSSRAGCASAPRSRWRSPARRVCCSPTSRRRRST